MIDWSEQHQMIRDALRRFVEAEIAPQVEALEHGDLPPYEILRKMFRTFGLDELARARFRGQMKREAKECRAAGERSQQVGRGDAAAMPLLAIIELCRHCPGMVTAMGVSVGLTAAAILSKGTPAQKERWALDLLTFDKIGAWAITEPDSGSDAFGSMKSTAKRDGQGGYLLNGTKTFITNGPYADTIVFICKLDEPGVARPIAPCSRSCSTAACPASPRASRCARWACTRRRPASSSSRTCSRRRAPARRERGRQSRSGAKATFSIERTGVAAMALGIVERCLELSLAYARERVQFGRPIGEFQLIQDKLARMEVARMNIQNLVFRQIELAAAGRTPTLAEASAMKLYSARRRWRSRSRRCRSTAATDTWPSTASSSSRATPRCCRSTRAPTRSRSPRSPVRCSRSPLPLQRSRPAGTAADAPCGRESARSLVKVRSVPPNSSPKSCTCAGDRPAPSARGEHRWRSAAPTRTGETPAAATSRRG
jgi:alkylation response protein AidB-like acyl-CoA dehydrogenase